MNARQPRSSVKPAKAGGQTNLNAVAASGQSGTRLS